MALSTGNLTLSEVCDYLGLIGDHRNLRDCFLTSRGRGYFDERYVNNYNSLSDFRGCSMRPINIHLDPNINVDGGWEGDDGRFSTDYFEEDYRKML